MNWAILVVAGLFEVGWAIGLKYTGLHPILANRLDSSVDDRQPWTIRSCHEGASGRHGLQCLGRSGSYRHHNIWNRAVWRTCERGAANQCCAHTRWDCRPQALNVNNVRAVPWLLNR